MFSNPYTGGNFLSRGLGAVKAINWSSLLDGTQKTLGVINQAIPIFYQVKPIISNAKTMFRIADVVRNDNFNDNSNNNGNDNSGIPASSSSNTSPIFYI